MPTGEATFSGPFANTDATISGQYKACRATSTNPVRPKTRRDGFQAENRSRRMLGSPQNAVPCLRSPNVYMRVIVGAKNLTSLPIVELAAFWLLASSDHGQPYINVAQVSSHRLSKPSCDAGRNHRASASTDRAAANSEDKAAHPRPV